MVLAAGLLHAESGSALTLTPTSLVLDLTGFEIQFLGAVEGVPAGGTVLAGSVASTDATLIFRVAAPTAAYVPTLPYLVFGLRGAPGGPTVGVGTIAGSDVAIPGTNAVVGANAGFGGVEIPALAMGEVTDPFFISYASLSDGDELEWATVSGLVGLLQYSTVVPEPSSALLVGLGLLGVARRRSRA